MIVFEEGKTIGVWFFPLPNDFRYDEHHVGGDWLCALSYTDKTKKEVEVCYRFRYHMKEGSGDPFKDMEGDDETKRDIKRWFSGKISTEKFTESYLIATIRHVANSMADISGNREEITELLVGNDFDGFMKKFENTRFAYSRLESKEEAEKLLGKDGLLNKVSK